jgi:hypothetical protein
MAIPASLRRDHSTPLVFDARRKFKHRFRTTLDPPARF